MQSLAFRLNAIRGALEERRLGWQWRGDYTALHYAIMGALIEREVEQERMAGLLARLDCLQGRTGLVRHGRG